MAGKTLNLYLDKIPVWEKLPPEKAYTFLMALLYYQRDGTLPRFASVYEEALFMAFKGAIDEDNKKYNAKVEKLKQFKDKDKTVSNRNDTKRTETVHNSTVSNRSGRDTDTDTVTDTDISKDIYNDTLMSGKPDGRVVEIVDYLNLVLGTHYKVNGKKTGSLIRSRLKEGYTVEDFKQVITKKHAEWAGTEREKYLRPETLFCADHFEGYLNQMYVAEKSPAQSVADEWMAWAEREEAKERGDYVDTEGVCEPDGDGDSFLPDFGD